MLEVIRGELGICELVSLTELGPDGFASEVRALRDANATSSDTAARPRPPWPSDCSTRRVGGLAGERVCLKVGIGTCPLTSTKAARLPATDVRPRYRTRSSGAMTHVRSCRGEVGPTLVMKQFWSSSSHSSEAAGWMNGAYRRSRRCPTATGSRQNRQDERSTPDGADARRVPYRRGVLESHGQCSCAKCQPVSRCRVTRSSRTWNLAGA